MTVHEVALDSGAALAIGERLDMTDTELNRCNPGSGSGSRVWTPFPNQVASADDCCTHGELGGNGTGELVDDLAILVGLEGRHSLDALLLGDVLCIVSSYSFVTSVGGEARAPFTASAGADNCL